VLNTARLQKKRAIAKLLKISGAFSYPAESEKRHPENNDPKIERHCNGHSWPDKCGGLKDKF